MPAHDCRGSARAGIVTSTQGLIRYGLFLPRSSVVAKCVAVLVVAICGSIWRSNRTMTARRRSVWQSQNMPQVDLRASAVHLDGAWIPKRFQAHHGRTVWDAARCLDKALLHGFRHAAASVQRVCGLQQPRGELVTQQSAKWLLDDIESTCSKLGVFPCPDIYITNQVSPFACAGPRALCNSSNRLCHSWITISRGALFRLSRAEVRAVVAHELAHQGLDHSLRLGFDLLDWYRLFALRVLSRGDEVSDAELGCMVVGLWFLIGLRSRAAELSADRAMLVVVNLPVALRALVKMSLPDVDDEDVRGIIEQERNSAARCGTFLRLQSLMMGSSHPCLALRIAELSLYSKTRNMNVLDNVARNKNSHRSLHR